MSEEYMTREDAAEHLDVALFHIDAMIENNEIRATTIAGVVMLYAEEILSHPMARDIMPSMEHLSEMVAKIVGPR